MEWTEQYFGAAYRVPGEGLRKGMALETSRTAMVARSIKVVPLRLKTRDESCARKPGAAKVGRSVVRGRISTSGFHFTKDDGQQQTLHLDKMLQKFFGWRILAKVQ